MDITVHLRQPSGNTFPVITKARKTVRQFKEQDVAVLLEKCWEDIMLLMGHEEMKGQKQLHSYGVRDGSTLDILLRLRGGEDNTVVDAKVFNIVLPVPKVVVEEEVVSDDGSEDETYEHLTVLDYIYGCEIDKDDVITDAMQLYASSSCDLFDNPKTIMVKEFRGRNLFSIEIDKYDRILAKYVKKEIANRLQFLAKQNGSSVFITVDDFLLNGLGDDDVVSTDVELLLRLRGGVKTIRTGALVSAKCRVIDCVKTVEDNIASYVKALPASTSEAVLTEHLAKMLQNRPDDFDYIQKQLETSGAGSWEVKFKHIALRFFDGMEVEKMADDFKNVKISSECVLTNVIESIAWNYAEKGKLYELSALISKMDAMKTVAKSKVSTGDTHMG
eukprot:s462_g53.t1